MIPKIIHYCWLSNDPIPKNLQKYIDDWRVKLPDYEFLLWNFDRFDRDSSIWVKQAFENKKYAFAADYIRLFALYNYGGIYLDMDVEVVKPFDPLLSLNTMMCYEAFGDRFEMATFGVEKQAEWVKKVLDYYLERNFVINDDKFDMKVVPKIVFETFDLNNIQVKTVSNIEEATAAELESKIPIFTSDYFSPKSYETGKILLTSNSYSIHHFEGSWLPNYVKLEHRFWNYLGLHDINLIPRFIKYWKYFKNKFN